MPLKETKFNEKLPPKNAPLCFQLFIDVPCQFFISDQAALLRPGPTGRIRKRPDDEVEALRGKEQTAPSRFIQAIRQRQQLVGGQGGVHQWRAGKRNMKFYILTDARSACSFFGSPEETCEYERPLLQREIRAWPYWKLFISFIS